LTDLKQANASRLPNIPVNQWSPKSWPLRMVCWPLL
jgi:hypothetical protein